MFRQSQLEEGRKSPDIRDQWSSTKGDLIIPPGQDIFYGEPGIVYVVGKQRGIPIISEMEKPKPFFVTSPKNPKSAHEIETFEKEDIAPAVYNAKGELLRAASTRYLYNFKIKNRADENIYAISLLTPGDKIIARPFEYTDPENDKRRIIHPYALQVIQFEERQKEVEGRPDMGHGIQVKHIGYMYKEDIGQADEAFRPVSEDIFPHRPSKEDVKQSRMGDCFFLSSLNAILAKPGGERFIRGMMRQQNDGTTIVRLFNPQTLKPAYVRVENSFHHVGDYNVVNHGAPWVHILEKAYAGLGFEIKDKKNAEKKYQAVLGKAEETKESEDEFAISPASFLSAYGTGGKAHLAMTVLTGKRAAVHQIKKLYNENPFNSEVQSFISSYLVEIMGLIEKNSPKDKTGSDLSVSKNFRAYPAVLGPREIDKILDEFKTQNMSKPINNSLAQSALGDALMQDKSSLLDWACYVQKINLFYPETYKQFKQIRKYNPKGAEYMPTHPKDYLTMISSMRALDPPPPANVMAALEDYVKNRMPGFIGSGRYDKDEIHLYNTLENAYKVGQCLTISTNETFEDKPANGLLISHEYSITHVYKNPQGLLMVRIRNPWGEVGRKYETDNGEIVSKEDKAAAEFDLEISDIVRYFDYYCEGHIPTSYHISLSAHAEVQEKLDKITQILRSFRESDDAEKHRCINVFVNLDAEQQKALLNRVHLSDLYAIHRFLQKEINHDEKRLPTVKPEIKASLMEDNDRRKETLKHTKDVFTEKFTKDKEYPTIKSHADRYAKEHSKVINENQTDCFKIFNDHLQFVREYNLLLKRVTLMQPDLKKQYIERLMTLPPLLQASALKVQTLTDLTELHHTCNALSEASQNRNEPLNALMNKIGIYAVQLNDLLGRPNLLAGDYLRAHPQRLMELIKDHLPPDAKLDLNHRKAVRIQLTDPRSRAYSIEVALNSGAYTRPTELSKNDVLHFASLQYAQSCLPEAKKVLLRSDTAQSPESHISRPSI